MALGLLDLSIITDHLIKLIRDSIQTSSLWSAEPRPAEGAPPGVDPTARFDIRVTGDPPDTIRDRDGCQLSVYLFHVSQDKHQRNALMAPPDVRQQAAAVTARQNPTMATAQPLGLELYFLLTASSRGAYIQEQQAMSIALKCFHENPILNPAGSSDGRRDKFTLTMAVENADELGRLWQAITTSLRLSAIYKVTVVFLEPPAPPRSQQVLSYNLVGTDPPLTPNVPANRAVGLSSLLFGDEGQIVGTGATVPFVGPDNVTRTIEYAPAVITAGQSFHASGAGFGRVQASDHVYALATGGDPKTDERDLTAWLDPQHSSSAMLAMTVPSSADLAKAGLTAGVYQLRVGNAIPVGQNGSLRSAGIPFSLAAFVDPAGGPLLALAGQTLTLNGAGFVAGKTEVLLDSIALTEKTGGANPRPGEFQVTGNGASVAFTLPASLAAGRYAVRVRVNGVQSPPAKWVDVP